MAKVRLSLLDGRREEICCLLYSVRSSSAVHSAQSTAGCVAAKPAHVVHRFCPYVIG